jgi:hypothetical protein
MIMNALAKTSSQNMVVRPILMPQTFDQLVRFAELAAGTDMVPKDYRGKPGNIMIACQMGSELGLSPMQSINSIAVINGRPGVWGDGLIGICRQSPLCQDIVETFEGEGEARTAICIATRRGASPTTGRFSVADAKRAGLWGTNVWAKYPDRMLQNRARGFALRDAFPDLLRGLKTVEELRDTPVDNFRGTTLEAQPEPQRAEPVADGIPDRVMNASKPRTRRDFLNDLHATLGACHTTEEVETIAQSAEVEKAVATFTNGALDELNAMIVEALERVKEAEPETADDELFPGDKP